TIFATAASGPAAVRMSTLRFFPLIHPSSWRDCPNASTFPVGTIVGDRIPMRVLLSAGCPWVASGAVRRPPAKAPRNTRRSIGPPSGREGEQSEGGQRDDLTPAGGATGLPLRRLPAPLTFSVVRLLHLEPLQRPAAHVGRLRVLRHQALVAVLDDL